MVANAKMGMNNSNVGPSEEPQIMTKKKQFNMVGRQGNGGQGKGTQ